MGIDVSNPRRFAGELYQLKGGPGRLVRSIVTKIMFGVVICAHGNLAHELLKTVEFIAGKLDQFIAVAIDHELDVEKAREAIDQAIRSVDTGDGVIVCTDLFGGTPSNLCLSFLDDRPIEIIAGINLPILLKTVTIREGRDLGKAVETLREHGIKNIFNARELLSKKKKPPPSESLSGSNPKRVL